jgi:hypothetical protein
VVMGNVIIWLLLSVFVKQNLISLK